MAYSEKLLDYFDNPRCVGEIEGADGIAEVSNPVCGDSLRLSLRIVGDRIVDARFKAQGCPAAIATSSFATEMVIGMDVRSAGGITREQIADALGGLPPSKIHCSVLAADAIRTAIESSNRAKTRQQDAAGDP